MQRLSMRRKKRPLRKLCWNCDIKSNDTTALLEFNVIF